jgi:putative endonuclease
VRAAQHYRLRLPVLPPCRFDVLAVEGGQIRWIQGAFDAALSSAFLAYCRAKDSV